MTRPRISERALALLPEDGSPQAKAARAREIDALLKHYVRTREERTRDLIVAEFLPLAYKLARRYVHSSEPSEDLSQVASLALLKAIERFDPERGASFVSFAIPTILGELKRYFRDSTWALHVPRRAQERIQAIDACRERLTNENHRAPSVQLIAQELELSVEEVLDSILAKRAYDAEPLDAPRAHDSEEGGLEVAETVGSEDPGYALVEDGATVAPALGQLSDRERMLLDLRFRGEMSQTEIAAKIGVSQMQVSRLLASTLAHVRELSGLEAPSA